MQAGVVMHILIGTDGSEQAIAAVTAALRLLTRPDKVTIVTVGHEPAVVTQGLESGFAGGVASPDEVAAGWKQVETAMHAALESTARAVTDSAGAVPLVKLTKLGDPAKALCEVARELSADVLVVGSRGRGFLKSALLGSVSSQVVHHAPCPVLVLRAAP
jgi:nucleotide-binding universal stress UspA family protein